MSRRLLVPMDDSEPARRALEHALTVFPDAEVTALHVVDPVEGPYGGDTEGPSDFEPALDIARDHDRGIETAITEGDGQTAEAIVEYAESNGFDQIVMGSHGRTGVSRVLIGSVADSVIRSAALPITVVR